MPKSYTKGATKITKTVYKKKEEVLLDRPQVYYEQRSRKSNEFFMIDDRLRSKSPHPKYNYMNTITMDRPRSKSPMSINRLNDRDNIGVYKSRSKSPVNVYKSNQIAKEKVYFILFYKLKLYFYFIDRKWMIQACINYMKLLKDINGM